MSSQTIILVVEDEEPLRKLICAMLAQSGYRTLEAADGLEALSLWEVHRNSITLVLTDIVMPRMAGGELARAVKQHKPDTPVLFISGYNDDPGVQELKHMGCDFLSKPFTPRALTAKIREALGSCARGD